MCPGALELIRSTLSENHSLSEVVPTANVKPSRIAGRSWLNPELLNKSISKFKVNAKKFCDVATGYCGEDFCKTSVAIRKVN